MANERQVVSAFKLECVGADPLQRREPVEISLTVYSDGNRDIGCSYLKRVGREGNSTAHDICDNNKLSNQNLKCAQISHHNL